MGSTASTCGTFSEEKPTSIGAALQGGQEVALIGMVQRTSARALFAWRGSQGTTLMQEIAKRGYSLVVEHLLENGTAAQLQEKADAQGNYSTHLAAKNGHLSTAALLAKGLPAEVHLQANSDNADALMLALASLNKARYLQHEAQGLVELLSLFPSEVLAHGLATCRLEGKAILAHLTGARELEWIYIVMQHISQRREWRDILCRLDSDGKNVAHYVVQQDVSWGGNTSRQGVYRSCLRTATFEHVLDSIPGEAFAMEDAQGTRPWQHFATSTSAHKSCIYRLAHILSHTPADELYADEEPEESRLEKARSALRVTLNSERPDFCRLLQEVLSFLPQGTADYGGGGEQTPLVLALERGRLEVCEVLASFMGEEGFLAVDGKGESFVHRVVRRLGYCRDLQLMRGLEANPNNEDSLRDDHLRFIKDTVCGRVEPQRLLTLRNQSGLTAADLAQQLEMPVLAGQLRPMTAKAARS